jgi:hypothetical protein
MSMTQSTVDTVRTPPLCVELDGVVILSNSFYESLLALLLARPWSLMLLPLWMLRGRAGGNPVRSHGLCNKGQDQLGHGIAARCDPVRCVGSFTPLVREPC